MGKFWIVIFVLLSIIFAGCSGLRSTRDILPVPNPDIVILPITKAIATTKDNVSIIAVYLKDVKDLDGFGIMIINESSGWLSFKKEECMLVQDGQVKRPLSDSKALARLGSGYKPKMPNELNVDIYGWRKDINTRSSRDFKIMDKDDEKDPTIKISLPTGSKGNVFVYFPTQGSTSPLQLIIPNIYNETTKQRTQFIFSFTVAKK